MKKKTTLILSDVVMQRLREKAVGDHRSLSSIVEEAVQRYLAGPAKPVASLPPLPTYEGGGFFVDVANREALYDVLDRED